ncbi:MAG: DUF2169 domain-containing protein [Pseudomonadota bacterium]
MQLENTTPFAADLNFAFEKTGRELVIIAIKATFDFAAQGTVALPSEDQRPLLYSDEFGQDPEKDATRFENDFAPFKHHCDVLCDGSAIAPNGRPVTALHVGLRLGQWSKAFGIIGHRIWLRSAMGHRVSDPRPFTEMAINYETAWGGTDPDPDTPGHAATFEKNPSGLGFYPHRRDLEGAPLPVTHELGTDVASKSGDYRPMALGPIGRHWLPRRKFAGTYDQDWLDRRMPFLPDDFDSRYFQAAPPDQQIPYLMGGEPIELYNLTTEGRLGFFLPQELLTVTFHRKSGPVTQKVPPIDTVQVLAAERQLTLTWRTRFACDRDIHDLSEIIIRRGTG